MKPSIACEVSVDVQAKENMRADTFIGRKKKPLKWAVFSCGQNGFSNIKCEILPTRTYLYKVSYYKVSDFVFRFLVSEIRDGWMTVTILCKPLMTL